MIFILSVTYFDCVVKLTMVVNEKVDDDDDDDDDDDVVVYDDDGGCDYDKVTIVMMYIKDLTFHGKNYVRILSNIAFSNSVIRCPSSESY